MLERVRTAGITNDAEAAMSHQHNRDAGQDTSGHVLDGRRPTRNVCTVSMSVSTSNPLGHGNCLDLTVKWAQIPQAAKPRRPQVLVVGCHADQCVMEVAPSKCNLAQAGHVAPITVDAW